MTQTEALKLALDALETEQDIYRENDEDGAPEHILEAITAIKEALAQPELPPECQTEAEKTAFAFGWFKAMEAQRTWVGLTNDEIETLSYKAEGNTWKAVELAEAKLKEKNT